MAFPAIQTADNKSGSQTSNSSSWTITYPTNLVSGDLIMLFAGIDGTGNNPSATGWTTWCQGTDSAASTGLVMYKVSDGTETGTFTLTVGASEQGSWFTRRITGWYNGGVPAPNATDSDSLAVSTPIGGSGSSANPNPLNCDPANWATEDTLWIACAMWDGTPTCSVFPLASNNATLTSGGAGGAGIAICTMDDAVSSKDPGTFTISASETWRVYTIAVRPAAEAVRVPRSPGVDSGNAHLAKAWQAARRWRHSAGGIFVPDISFVH